jgi:protein-S-isoprenylcysteine O-methyltransferase Ste14
MKNLFKSILHNIGVVVIGLILAFIASKVDAWLEIREIRSVLVFELGVILICIGFLIRIWATYYFYQAQMKVIVLKAQSSLITGGPYNYSRNPLYLGGNVFVFYGAAFLFGSITGLVVTTLHLPLVDLMIRREEKQLEVQFGQSFIDYKNKVRRWI